MRVVGLAAFAVLTVALAPILARVVPTQFGPGLGSVPVDQILTILASSMLAVTTFSLSIAVSAFAAAASNATPRATALLQEDPTTQNVLATFLGAFLFSLIGLIALRTDFFDRSTQVFLFLATRVMVALVVVALLRWISHLMSFGRMSDTLDRVEGAAASSLEQRLANPYLGGTPLHETIPEDALPIAAGVTGYVQHVDLKALAECARELDAELYLAALPGSFVHDASELLQVRFHQAGGSAPDEEQTDALRDGFTVGAERSFDQDPRFGLIVLSEIAVLRRLVCVLACWVERAAPAVDYPAVHAPPVRSADMLYDAFRPFARDGAALFEVQMRLHKALDAQRRIAPAAGVSETERSALEDVAIGS